MAEVLVEKKKKVTKVVTSKKLEIINLASPLEAEALMEGFRVGAVDIKASPDAWKIQLDNRWCMSFGYSQGAFNNCGASFVKGFNSGELTEREKQNFAWALKTILLKGPYTYYGLPASYQLPDNTHTKRLYAGLTPLLLELGMEIVDERPNRNHGPYNMHTAILDSSVMLKKTAAWDKYIRMTRMTTGYECPVPLWFAELSVEEQKELDKKSREIWQQRQQEFQEKAEREKNRRWTKSMTDATTLMAILDDNLNHNSHNYGIRFDKEVLDNLRFRMPALMERMQRIQEAFTKEKK